MAPRNSPFRYCPYFWPNADLQSIKYHRILFFIVNEGRQFATPYTPDRGAGGRIQRSMPLVMLLCVCALDGRRVRTPHYRVAFVGPEKKCYSLIIVVFSIRCCAAGVPMSSTNHKRSDREKKENEDRGKARKKPMHEIYYNSLLSLLLVGERDPSLFEILIFTRGCSNHNLPWTQKP